MESINIDELALISLSIDCCLMKVFKLLATVIGEVYGQEGQFIELTEDKLLLNNEKLSKVPHKGQNCDMSVCTIRMNDIDRINKDAILLTDQLKTLLGSIQKDVNNMSITTQNATDLISKSIESLHESLLSTMNQAVTWMSQMDEFCDTLSYLINMMDQLGQTRQALAKLDNSL